MSSQTRFHPGNTTHTYTHTISLSSICYWEYNTDPLPSESQWTLHRCIDDVANVLRKERSLFINPILPNYIAQKGLNGILGNRKRIWKRTKLTARFSGWRANQTLLVEVNQMTTATKEKCGLVPSAIVLCTMWTSCVAYLAKEVTPNEWKVGEFRLGP